MRYLRVYKLIYSIIRSLKFQDYPLVLKRNATRDYLDFVALADHLGDERVVQALRPFDTLYPQDSGESPLQQLHVQLASPVPYDLEETELAEYKRLVPRWRDWNAVKAAGARLSTILFDRLCALEAGPENSRTIEIDGVKKVAFHPMKRAPSP